MSTERYLQTVDLYREGKHACMEIEDLEVSHVQCEYLNSYQSQYCYTSRVSSIGFKMEL